MMSDLSNTLRNMKFMQRTSDSRKKSFKKPTTSQSIPIPPSTPIITMPDHPGCWRIIENNGIISSSSSSKTPTVNANHPLIIHRNSVFSIHDRAYTRLSFQNFNKRLEPIMIKYGLKEELNNLEDGEIDPNDDDAEDKKQTINEDDVESKDETTSLGKTIRKKFTKKSFSRIQFDNKTRINKRKRKTRQN